MVDIIPAMRGLMEDTVPDDQVVATAADAIAGTSNLLIMTPLQVKNAMTGAGSMTPANSQTTFVDIQTATNSFVPEPVQSINTQYYSQMTLEGGATYRLSDAAEVANYPASASFTTNDGNKYWLINNNPVTPEMFGAIGNGTTDDSQAFTDALATSWEVLCLSNTKYAIKDINIASSRILDGQGARFVPFAGAKWMFRLSGFEPTFINGRLDDASGVLVRSTTLSAGVSAAATNFTVASAVGLEIGMIATVLMTNGRWHISPITAIAGTTITVARGFEATASIGAAVDCSWGEINIRGVLRAKVSNMVMINTSFGIVNDVDPSSGLFYVTNTKSMITDIRISDTIHVGIFSGRNCADTWYQRISSRGGRGQTTNAIGDGSTDTFSFAGKAWRLSDTTVTVNNVGKVNPSQWTYLTPSQLKFTAGNVPGVGQSIVISTYTHGKAGIVIDTNGSNGIQGGDTYSIVECLAYLRGLELHNKTLTSFDQIISDTISGEAMLLDTTSILGLSDVYLGYAFAPIVAYGNNVNVTFNGPFWTSQPPTSDMVSGTIGPYAVDSRAGSTLSINTSGWRIGSLKSRNVAGTYIFFGQEAYQIADNNVTPAGTTSYFGPPGQSTTIGRSFWVPPRTVRITRLYILNSSAPGAGKAYTYTVQVDGADTAITGATTDSGFSFDLSTDLQVQALHRIQLKIVTDAATPANNSFRGFIEVI